MACSGAHCTNHGTGTTTCSQHRASCATNRPLSVTADFGVTGRTIRGSDVENLRVNIRAEMSRWNLHANYNYTLKQAAAVSAGQVMDDTVPEALDNMVKQMNGGTYFTDLNGLLIDDTHWSSIKNTYNTIRQNCICNADCACNNVCACHNDCACNYSDERLKTNIKFIKTSNGLNIYSWNYVWDKATEFKGVIAQQLVNTKFSDALSTDDNGFYIVNYNKLPAF